MRGFPFRSIPVLAAAGVFALFFLARTDDPLPPEYVRTFLEPGAFTAVRCDVPEFESLFGLIRRTLDRNKVSFESKAGLVRGFSAGSSYPQIWLRDAATIIPASRFFYPASYLRSWLAAHLDLQKKDGSLEDWLDSRGKADKNTTETDQEASAVRSAAQISQISGISWLSAEIGGETILDRLEKALLFVVRERFDQGTGLVKGAHTIDWGDVEMEEEGPGAIYAGPGTHWTADIYDQAQFYGAARGLADLMESTGHPEKAAAWRGRAEEVKRNADRLLWQSARGFYRVHIHLTPLVHPFDEDALFAMGGNVEAALSGLAAPNKARRIIETALARQKEFKMSTISGVLLPPYPPGVFKHPQVNRPFTYQNGGQWDWFGGKLVLAMFENGFAAEGREKLLEIARKAAANGDFYEWDTPDGKGRGSPRYTGSAGSMARALIEGYYGIGLRDGSLSLRPRLGREGGAVHVFVPSAGRYAGYIYAFDAAESLITMAYGADWAPQATIDIFWPTGGKSGGPVPIPRAFDVRVDGAAVPYRLRTDGQEISVVLEAQGAGHVVTVRPRNR